MKGWRLTGLRLRNICQHGAFECSFGSGLTALLGRNGSGKTSVFRGLVYALTGAVDGDWGSQQDLQKDGTSVVGYAEALFTDGESQYSVRRYSTSSVKFPDVVVKGAETVARRRRQVDSFMEGVFGMPCALMFQLCWGRQGQLAGLLKAPPAAVGAFLAQVFNTSRLEKLRMHLKDAMDTVATLPDRSESLAARRKELENLQPDSFYAEQLASVEAELRREEETRDRLAALSATGIPKADRDAALNRLMSTRVSLNERLAVMEKPDIPEPEDVFGKLCSDYVAAGNALSEASTRLEGCSQLLKAALAEAASLRAERDRFASSVAATDAKLSDPGMVCSLCGADVHDNAAYLDRMCSMLTGCGSRAEWDRSKRGRMAEFDSRISGVEGRKVPELQERQNALLHEYGKLKSRLAETEKLRKARLYYDTVKSLDRVTAEIGKVNGTPVADEEVARERERNASLLGLLQDRHRRLLVEQASSRTSRENLEKGIAEDAEAVRQCAVNREAREVLGAMREALSQPRAQARYLKSRISSLNAVLKRYTALTGMPFTLYLDEGRRAFVYVTGDGYEHPAAHLSGAQQAMSAVALQMALFTVMQPGMNLYLIDEPAESLDSGNKETMAAMFGRMSGILPDVNGTMVVITRDVPVVSCCGSVIELKENQ